MNGAPSAGAATVSSSGRPLISSLLWVVPPYQVLLHAQEAVLAAQSRQAHRCGSFSV
jgi:hypothetical protein